MSRHSKICETTIYYVANYNSLRPVAKGDPVPFSYSSIYDSRFPEFLPLIYPPELEVNDTADTASSASL
jgi:hypothetical protein